MAAVQETGATRLLDPEIKMEEQDLVGPEAGEVREGAALPKMGNNGGKAGQTVKQEPEEEASKNWDAQLEVFLRTLQSPHAAGEKALQQAEAQVPPQGVSEAKKWPRGLWVSPNQAHLAEGATEDDESHLAATHVGKGKEETPGKGAVGLEVQRQCFRMLSYREADGPRNLCQQLRELCRKWLMPERHTKEQMLELVTLEQFLVVLPLDMQHWLREHNPETCTQAVTLAEDFLLKQRGSKRWEGQITKMSKEETVNPPKANEAQLSMIKMTLLTETEHKDNGEENVLGLTESEEQKPLFESVEEMEQLMTPMKSGKENSFLCHRELDKKQEKVDKEFRNSKEKVEDLFVSSQGVCKSNSEPTILDEENEVKYDKTGERFSQNSHLIMHEGRDVEEKLYRCWHCGESFSSSSNLVTHERTHVGEKLHICSRCGECERTHTGQKPHRCSHCGSTVGWNPQDRIQAGEKPHMCTECGEGCSQRSNLLKHQTGISKSKEWSTKLREEIIALHKQGTGYKKIAKALNVPRDTVGSIVRKFKVKGTVVTLPGRGRKRKLSTAAARLLRSQVEKNPRVTAKDLQQDLVATGTEVSVSTVRRVLNAKGFQDV